MKILHTADWHLGDRLGRIDRTSDLQRAVERVGQYCREKEVEVLLIAGDLFSELSRPEGLRQSIAHFRSVFGDFLLQGGTAVAITGNHDNENFCQTLGHALSLAAPLAEGDGALLGPGRLYLATGPAFFRLRDRAGQEVQFVGMPYPTVARYLDNPAERFPSLEEKNQALQAGFRRRLDAILASPHYRPDLPAVLAAHVHVQGAALPTLFRISEAESVVFDEGAFADRFAYVALGHIHKPQFLGGKPTVRYCGSIERLDLGERHDQKCVVLLEVGPDGCREEPVELPLDATPMHDVEISSPTEELPVLREFYPDAERALVRYQLKYTAGTDNLEALLRELDGIFPRWYERSWHEAGDLGLARAAGSADTHKSFHATVLDYLDEALFDHPDLAPIRQRAESLLAEEAGMIPQRIAVQGFLCYRDEQEIQFDSAALWLLAGLNGSGKSAVFDGVTYALFGGHRAGKEHAEELINKNGDRAAVEFDFLLDGQLYRARRTIKRKKQGGTTPTQQMCRWERGADGTTGSWVAIPDTTNKRDFDRWVQENVGLTYETFTSSVLLMQGRAEKLLSASPKDRFEVLAGIVDLERFQRLHERADNRRRVLKEEVEVLQQQLSRVAEVSDAELDEAEQRSATAEEALQRAQAEGERLQRLEVQAEQWQDRQSKLVAARQQFQRAEQLRADAANIERDWVRLRELRLVVPQLRTILEQRERLTRATTASERLAAEQRALAERLGQRTTVAEESRQKQEGLQQALHDEQQREQAVGAELRELVAVLGSVHVCERQRRELVRLDAELAKLPADPAGLVAQEQREHERLTLLNQAVPLLGRFRGEREELRQANAEERKALADQAAVQKEGEELKPAVAALGEQAEKAGAERRHAAERATATRTLLDHARQQLAQLDELVGAKVCGHCGQALTAAHIEDERQRRCKALAEAETASTTAAAASEAALQTEARLLQLKLEKERDLHALREEFKECRQRQQEAEREAQRRGRECLRLYHELPEPFRARVAPQQVVDWMTTVYPRKEDLDQVQVEAQGKTAALRRLQEAQAVHERWNTLRVERDTTQRALAAQEAELPGDVDTLRLRHTELEVEDLALKKALKVRREETKLLQTALVQLEREQRTMREQLSDLGQQWGAEEARREEGQKALERGRTALPCDWQARADTLTAAEVHSLQDERQALEQTGVEARGEELAHARTGLEALQRRVLELEEEADQLPADARCDPADVKRRRTLARQDQADRESALLQVRQEKAQLLERRDQRRHLQEQHATLDREHNLQRLLSELLGRNRLQLFLVRQAERGIVDYANAVLDRLSAGQLYLRLRGSEDEGGAEQALQLEAYNRGTGQAPIGVAFLSGSQRFRVAVSLALGIGQYASKQHRPIESVIIDEGFGCLDRQGRQVMIQELQNLRGQLRCILLVSHQEEFAEAFADGYRFELNDGSTQVTRFQR